MHFYSQSNAIIGFMWLNSDVLDYKLFSKLKMVLAEMTMSGNQYLYQWKLQVWLDA